MTITVGREGIVIGFLVADSYNSYFGVLGSLPNMEISLGFLVLPYRLVAAFSILLLLYAGFLFVSHRRVGSK